MTEREKLIDLLGVTLWDTLCDHCGADKGSDREKVLDATVDYLLGNGVIVLPCKVGDTVYLSGGRKATVTSFYHTKNISQGNCWLTVKCNRRRNNEKRLCLPISKFGQSIFLTKEEEERALKGRGR